MRTGARGPAGRRDWLALPHRRTRPDDLHVAFDELAHAMDDPPWMATAGGSDETGQQHCV
ncbi:hypothetical protein [Streptomyces virginiae]|uniref:hypothetical protein n=1 Tax=Streptomyces virginiae TaxID=1961 RepID=UPI003868C173|nr:hypothetical protein OG253_42075 [Streptomyces virginiae]